MGLIVISLGVMRTKINFWPGARGAEGACLHKNFADSMKRVFYKVPMPLQLDEYYPAMPPKFKMFPTAVFGQRELRESNLILISIN